MVSLGLPDGFSMTPMLEPGMEVWETGVPPSPALGGGGGSVGQNLTWDIVGL